MNKTELTTLLLFIYDFVALCVMIIVGMYMLDKNMFAGIVILLLVGFKLESFLCFFHKKEEKKVRRGTKCRLKV